MITNKKKSQPIIMQVLPALKQGGVETGAIDLANFLTNKKVENYIISDGGKMVEKLKNPASHIKLQIGSKNIFKAFYNYFVMVKLIKQYKPDIVHVRSRMPAWVCYFACKKTNTKFLTTFHTNGPISKKIKNPILNYLYKKYNSVLVWSNPIIVGSKYVADKLVEVFNVNPLNIRIIYRWVDLDKYNIKNISKEKIQYYKKLYKIPNDKKTIFFCGRLSRIKGIDDLIVALSKIKQDFYCVIAGDAKNQMYLEELRSNIKKFKLQDKVILPGNCPEPYCVYPSVYLSVNSSIAPETFGRSVVESLASGIPCISTDIGGPKEIIVEGKSGWFVKPNSPKELQNAIEKALNLNKNDYNKIQESCKQRAKDFDLKEKCQQTLDLYKELV